MDALQDRQVTINPFHAEHRSNKASTPAPAPQRRRYVRLTNVSKTFGDFVAVDNVSLSIQRGEIFCLLGGSGSGKTTLLRMLAGFETPSSGRILIDGAGHERASRRTSGRST